MKETSIVINARTLSSRVPRKLVRPFADTTLLEIALAKLDRMDFFEHRYLATAENEIVELAKPFNNVEILRRESAAITPGVNPPAVTFAHYGKIPSDYIFTFNPCLPLIEISTVRESFEYFQKTDFLAYTSSIRTGDWIFNDKGEAVTNDDPNNPATNKGKIFYKAAHAFHIFSKAVWVKNSYIWTFTPNDPHLIQIPENQAVDVDTPLEFEFAEFAYINRSHD